MANNNDAVIKVTLEAQQAVDEALKLAKTLKTAFNAKGADNTILAKFRSDLEQMSGQTRATIGNVISQFEHLKSTVDEIADKEKKVKEIQEQIKQKTKEQADYKARIGELTAKQASGKTLSKDEAKELDEAQKAVARLDTELSKARSDQRAYNKEIRDSQSALESAKATANEFLANQKESLAYAEQHVTAEGQYVEQIEQSSQQMEEMNQSGSDLVDNLQEISNEAENVESAMEGAANASADLTGATQETDKGEKPISAPNTEDMATATQEVDTSLAGLLRTFGEYQNQLAQLESSDKEFATVQRELANTTQQLNDKLSFDPKTATYPELIRQLSELRQAQLAIQNMGMPKEMDSFYTQIAQKIGATRSAIRDYEQSFNGVKANANSASIASRNFGSSSEMAAKIAKKAFSAIPKLLGTIKSGFGGLTSATNKLKSSFNKMASSMKSNFKHMITNITKYVLGFRSLFFLVRRLRKYIGEGIQNMAQFEGGNNHVNESITRLLSSLLYLKNAWATAFSPILQVVTPILETLIDKIAEVGNAFSRFLGSLFGVSTVFQAVKVDAADYAKGLDKAGGSAGKAADKTKKLTDRLAAFDDLNVLGKDKDPDATGSGGGGGSADAYTPDVNEMFKLVDVGSEIKDKFMEMWENADFSELGDIVEEKIATALGNIDWTTIQDTAYNIGKSIITFINGALGDPTLWETAGSTVAEMGNTITQFLSGIFDNNEVDFGGGFATLINTFFDTFDWDTWNSLLVEFGTQLKDNINSFFANLDLFGEGGILADIEGATASLTTAIVTLIDGIDYAAVFNSAVGIADAILGGIEDGLKSSDNTIFQSLGDVVGSVKDAFDTLAPVLTPILDLIGQLAQAILPIISTLLPPIAELISSLATSVLPLISSVLDMLMPTITQIVESILPILQSLIESISPYFEALSNEALPVISDLLTEISPLIDVIISLIGTLASSLGPVMVKLVSLGSSCLRPLMPVLGDVIDLVVTLIECFITILDPILDLMQPLLDLMMIGLQPMISIFTLLAKIIVDVFGGAIKFASSIISGLAVVAIADLQVAINALGLVWWDLADIVTSVVGLVSDDWNSLTGVFKSVGNTIIGFVESMVNNVVKGLNGLLGGIEDISELAEAANIPVPKITKISSVSLPRLAQGAVIPPNKEFMAILGDQSSGTNIEAPLDTIKQALAEVMATNGNAEVIQLLQQLITVVESKNLVIGDKDIGKANARYQSTQRMIRGTSF